MILDLLNIKRELFNIRAISCFCLFLNIKFVIMQTRLNFTLSDTFGIFRLFKQFGLIDLSDQFFSYRFVSQMRSFDHLNHIFIPIQYA